MINMSTVNSIRQQRRDGCSVTEIAKRNGVSRDTVYKYLKRDDFSPEKPVKRAAPSKLDPYKAVIRQWMDEDSRCWRKQRHTARRIWQRLRDELGADVSESTVGRYVAKLRKRDRERSEQFLDLVWEPGQAQADFGEADFYVKGVRTRLSFFVMTFPYSNVGLAQVFPGENAECVCQALKQIFEYAKGVPTRIVFDNATGVGRRVCGKVRTTETFTAFAAHYGFAFSFCNPNAGHEKGNVESKVRFIRSNLFVPVPRFWRIDSFNKRLLDRCCALSKEHYLKGEDEKQLFMEDGIAMMGLPEAPFNVVKYIRCKANKQGKVQVDGRHWYSTDPALANRELIVGLGATELSVYTQDGERVCGHDRQYGDAPTDSANPASQLPLLTVKLGAWRNSAVRSSIPDGLRDYMDSLDRAQLGGSLRIMRDRVQRSGWDAAVGAMECALQSTGRLDEASVAVAAARAEGGSIAYDEPVDLSVYDAAMGKAV